MIVWRRKRGQTTFLSPDSQGARIRRARHGTRDHPSVTRRRRRFPQSSRAPTNALRGTSYCATPSQHALPPRGLTPCSWNSLRGLDTRHESSTCALWAPATAPTALPSRWSTSRRCRRPHATRSRTSSWHVTRSTARYGPRAARAYRAAAAHTPAANDQDSCDQGVATQERSEDARDGRDDATGHRRRVGPQPARAHRRPPTRHRNGSAHAVKRPG
jgi:hypothetical protein